MFQLGQNSQGLVVVLFENPKGLLFRSAAWSREELLFRQQADSSPINLVSE